MAARPGSGFHAIQASLSAVIYIFNMNVDVTHIHADHFLDGARHILLDVAADLTDIYILLEDEMQIHIDGILFRFNADPVACCLV